VDATLTFRNTHVQPRDRTIGSTDTFPPIPDRLAIRSKAKTNAKTTAPTISPDHESAWVIFSGGSSRFTPEAISLASWESISIHPPVAEKLIIFLI